MVTQIHKSAKKRLFLKEHREAKGISAEQMGGRLGIERESVYRQERQSRRVNAEKQAAWAEALGIEPEELWRLPPPHGSPSLDAMIKSAPEHVRAAIVDVVRRLVGEKL